MEGSPSSKSLPGALISPSTSTPAKPPPRDVTRLDRLTGLPFGHFFPELRSSEFDEPDVPIFNDPFTGIPSAPSDTVRLYMLCRLDPRYTCSSIPGSLLFLFMFAPPWKEDSRPFKAQMPPGLRPFRLRCEYECQPGPKPYCHHQNSTYVRLYTEWLFSGGAPASLAKLHRGTNGSTTVSFSAKVRAALYYLRAYWFRQYTLELTMPIISDIFDPTKNVEDPDEEAWCNRIIRTEPSEMPAMVWSHAYPLPKSPTASSLPIGSQPRVSASSNAIVQTQPFRGFASLQPTEPNDVPPGWFIWTPPVVPRLPPIARRTAFEYKRLKDLKYVDSVVAAPSHEMHLYWAARGIRLPSPDATLGAEEEDFEASDAGTDDNHPTQSLRKQLMHRLTQARPTHVAADTDTLKRARGRPRKSATPAPTLPVAKPTRIRLIAPRRPSTPEQTALFEEAMNDQSPPHAHNDGFDKANMQYSRVTEQANSHFSHDLQWQMFDLAARRKIDDLSEAYKNVEGVGVLASAYESCLYNPEDFK
ncbi:hypothetical protein D6D12_01504 [Aureobasidium pullulans]|uniref:Uncharacterized protein n=1 Tax=Aureobasidium pullulans TaxID=5580 RepID=A0AB74K494_AURPU|nr:hypothetical protein D6D12_01504 [Aureobasidium pullulans]THX45022.1 hypothetical protein D6D11_07709 [Aureobasidium pullulans]